MRDSDRQLQFVERYRQGNCRKFVWFAARYPDAAPPAPVVEMARLSSPVDADGAPVRDSSD